MSKEIKTLGYLLKHYTNSQCYDQYVPLKWLEEQNYLIERILFGDSYSYSFFDTPPSIELFVLFKSLWGVF